MNDENATPPLDRWARLAAEDRRKQKRCDRFMILLLMLTAPVIVFLIRSKLADDERRWRSLIARQTTNNLRQIGFGLLEFEIEYEKFPDTSTIAEVKKNTGTNLTFGDASSNDFFKQLLAQKLVGSESVFGVSGINMQQPDDLFDTDASAIIAGECGFGYLIGSTTRSEASRPLVFGPVRPGTRSVESTMIGGGVIVLFTDNSIKNCRMDPSGVIWINGTAFDLSHPAWNGKPLEIKWPK